MAVSRPGDARPSRHRLRSGAVAWSARDDEVVVLDLASSTYLRVNAAGAVLWPLLVEGATHDDLVEALVSAYGIERDQAGADVAAFVAAWDARGALAHTEGDA